MRRALAAVLMVVCVAAHAGAQGTKAPAKPDSAKAPATKAPGTKAPVTKTDAKAPAVPAPKPDTKQAAAPGTKTDSKQPATPAGTQTDTKQATKGVPPAANTNSKAAPAPAGPATKAPAPAATGTKVAPQAASPTTPTIMREVFGYAPEGRRDPFATLLTSSDLRPTVADLKLTGILYDENGSNSVAVMRDITDNKQYRVQTGQTIGRMKVALIKRKAVIFSIEAFGMNRQDSLVLGDTTKVRVVK